MSMQLWPGSLDRCRVSALLNHPETLQEKICGIGNVLFPPLYPAPVLLWLAEAFFTLHAPIFPCLWEVDLEGSVSDPQQK